MPALKSWTARISLIFQRLENDAQAVYTVSEVAAVFGIKRSQAAELMKIAGADVRNGIEATVSRSNLRYYVERSKEAEGYLIEMARQAKVAQKLREARDAVRIGAVIDAHANPLDKYVRFAELAAVSIADGKLTICFAGADDLTYKLYQLAMAMANEPGEYARLCEPDAASTPESLGIGDYARISEDDLREILTPATPEERERLGLAAGRRPAAETAGGPATCPTKSDN